MRFDLDRARRETPGCENVLHFNNAGAGLMPQAVLESVSNHLQLEANIGGYEAADQAQESLDNTYAAIARLLGAQPDEIALCDHATRAWDLAFYAIPLGPNDHILTAQAAYASNYIAMLQRARQTGASIEVIPNDEHGQVSISALRDMLNERVKLIALTHVPTNGGLVNPAAEMGELAREAGALFLLDACQSAGQLPLDVEVLGCDMLSGASRKYLRGPRGTGFLYVRRSALEQLEPPFLDLHAARWTAIDKYELRSDARRFESWERNIAATIGLGVATEYALEWGIDITYGRIQALAEALRERLVTIPGVSMYDVGKERCGIVTFSADEYEATEIQRTLAHEKINVTTSSVFSTRLDMEARQLPELVRASVHYYNSEVELDRFCSVLTTLVA